MAYTRRTNVPTDKDSSVRRAYDHRLAYQWYQSHTFTTEVSTTALDIYNDLIEKQQVGGKAIRMLPGVRLIRITNISTGAEKLYVGIGGVSSTDYEFVLTSGDSVEYPLEGTHRPDESGEFSIAIVGDTNPTLVRIVEYA